MISLRENEKIIRIIRQHYSVVTGVVFWSVAVAGLITFFLLEFKIDILGYSWEIIIGTALTAALIILYKIYIWRKNTLIITNQRVVINSRQGAFSLTVTELLYRDIYDISFKQIGLSALINRYGCLIMKTPSGSEIVFDKIPSPASVVETINKIRASMPISSQVYEQTKNGK